MKFAHMADCHIGGWRDENLKKLTIEAFNQAIDMCIPEKVDFVIIAGDLFNTALPPIDYIKLTIKKLKELKRAGIPVYLIAGSHDYSPNKKSMIDVLDEAELCINVSRKMQLADGKIKPHFFQDPKTKVKLTGVLGKMGGLDREIYKNLDLDYLEKEPGQKIFVFHTSLTELKPKGNEIGETQPVSYLPKGFTYYAGGHVHIVRNTGKEFKDYQNIVYPGPLFPETFDELEKLEHGGFYIYDDANMERKDITLKQVLKIRIDANHKTPVQVNNELQEFVETNEFNDKIVLIKVEGTLSEGRVSDINMKKYVRAIVDKKAYVVRKKTTGLTSKEFETISIDQSDAGEIEERIMKEHFGQVKIWFDEKSLAQKVLDLLAVEKNESEKVYEYQDRIIKDVKEIFDSLSAEDETER
ncbi:exonuclease SbcCD subunit D [Candidatus Woesearchaeota archaeon]|nr:exonuclease SbcCD subunit D [Candidatus Woesearchaeota archaeon]